MTTTSRIERLEQQTAALLERHSNARELTDFSRYLGRPVDFMRDELGFIPYDKQLEVIDSFVTQRRTAVRGFHGAGKDAILAPLMLYAAYVCGMLVLAISATEKQLLGQLWRELGNRFSTRLPGELYTADLRINGEKRIIAMTSGSVSNLTGWHDPKGVFIAISEAQGEQVESAAFDAAIANAVDAASRIVVVGNSVKAEGRFFEVSKKPTWNAIKISAFDHPNVREGREVIPGGPAPTWPAEMAAEFGEESAWYISRVLAEFPPEGSVDSLIRRAWLEAAYLRHDQGVRFTPFPIPVVALDVARSIDRDESVAAIAQDATLHALHAWRSRDLVATASRFLDVADRARAEWFLSRTNKRLDPNAGDGNHLDKWLNLMGAPKLPLHIDAPGVGSGCVDDVRHRGRMVTEYWGWNPAPDDKRFANLRASVYWHFRTLLESDRAVLPRDERFHEEALAMEWSQDAKGRIAMISKDELRKSLGRSPDRLDAGVIALAAASGGMPQPRVTITTYDPY